MVKELPQRRAALGPSGLLTVHGIKVCVEENTQRRKEKGPPRNVLLEGVVVVEHDPVRQDHEDTPNEGDEVGCHGLNGVSVTIGRNRVRYSQKGLSLLSSQE